MSANMSCFLSFIYFLNVENTEVTYIRLCYRLRDCQAQSGSLYCRELFYTLVPYRFAFANGLPFTVYPGFYFILTDTLTVPDVFLDNAMIDRLRLIQFQCQAFLLSGGRGNRRGEAAVYLVAPFFQSLYVAGWDQACCIGCQTDNQCCIPSDRLIIHIH